MFSTLSQSTIPQIPRYVPETHVTPPMVFVQPIWEYRHLVRALPDPGPLSKEDLNTLGADGWELVALHPEPPSLHFYLKRLRP